MNIRPITDADIDAFAALAAEDEAAFHGRHSRLGANDVRSWLARVDLAQDSWLYEEEGTLVAVSWFDFIDDLGFFVGIVAQGAKGRGLGSRIVDTGETRARDRGAARLQTFGLEPDTAAADLFEEHGFTLVRRFYEMAIELEAPPVVPALAEAFTLETFRLEDNEPNRNGGGYVGAMGVKRAWRGKGLGRALLLRTFAEFYSRGVPRVTLGVDAESPTGATKLYESVGMTIESAGVVYEKALV